MLVSWTLIQFDGGRLDGYGERPDGAPANRDYRHLRRRAARDSGRLVPVQQPDELRAAGRGDRASSATSPPCRSWARSCSAPSSRGSGHPHLVLRSRARKAEFQMMIAAMVLIIFNVVFWTLFEQAGSSLTLFADRNTDLQRVRPVQHLGRADPVLQRRLHRPAGAAVLACCGTALARSGTRAVDPDQVRRWR